MNNIFILPIEPIDTRYTRQWYDFIPENLAKYDTKNQFTIHTIDGDDVPAVPSPGAFLDFGATNIYKSSQLMRVAEMFRQGQIKSGDKFLITDFWNTAVLQIKYMSELLNIPVEIHGMAHAGNYDPQDFLGRLIKDNRWVNHTEQSFAYAYDKIWFATAYHRSLFLDNVFKDGHKFTPSELISKFVITGWPMEYMADVIKPFGENRQPNDKPVIVFPHRLAPEKQPEIFRDLANHLPDYECIVCQDTTLSKDEYHTIMTKADIVFSANLQETLGISAPEGMVNGAIPCLPNRLAYTEMYHPSFLYPSEWTESFAQYEKHRDDLIAFIDKLLAITTREQVELDFEHVSKQFFDGHNLYTNLTK